MSSFERKLSATPQKITARIVDQEGYIKGYCRVPILFDGQIPDVPQVIFTTHNNVASLTTTAPLTYTILGRPYETEAL